MSARRIRVATAAATDVGRKRTGNEDSHAVQGMNPAGGRPETTLLIACDGMGGSNAGEVASRMAVDAVLRAFGENASEDPGEALGRAVRLANDEVWEQNRSRAELRGMGTTCTALAIRPGEAVIAHVGDSRAYLVRAGRIRQLTRDHSLVAELVARGQLTPEEARRDPRRNVVTRSVGVAATVDPDVVRLEAPREGDTFLLCTDGLHGQLSDQELARIASGDSLETACGEMIRLGNERGGPDNITVLLARLEAPVTSARAADGLGRTGPGRRGRQLLIGALITLALAACGLAWVVSAKMRPGPKQDANSSPGETDSGR